MTAPSPHRPTSQVARSRAASLAAWDAVLDAVDVDLDDAERLLAATATVADRADAAHAGAVDAAALVPAPRGGADREPDPHVDRDLLLPARLPLDGLTPADLDDVLVRLRRLEARHRAVVPLLAAAMAANRRHRELLERASATHDRPVFVDRRA